MPSRSSTFGTPRTRHLGGPVALVGEHHRLQQHVPGHPLELEGPHDALAGHQVVEDAVEAVLAVALLAHESPPAAGPRLELVHGHLGVAAPPAAHDVGLVCAR